jgi:hypothetical protein
VEIRDKNGVIIDVGDLVLTDEGDWVGTVVRYGDYFKEHPDYKYKSDILILIDQDAGYSLEPNWEKCTRIGGNFLIKGKI